MSITHIAFDMDGVIYTAEDFIADAYKEAIKQSGLKLPMPSTSQIMEQIGKPIWEIYRNLFPGITQSEMQGFRNYTRKYVVKMVSEKKGRIYEGIPELIESLFKNYTLAACSNGGGRYIETILDTYSLRKYFIPILTLDSENINNKGELLNAYISKNGNNSSSWVMIGDRKTDLEAALFNNCRFIGCTWGHADDGELTGANVIVNSPGEIISVLSPSDKS
jgi:phosphoglycolate phosphatase-like HAD superfamily hydrolase